MSNDIASSAVLAARLVIETGCSYSAAGRKFGISHGPVRNAYARLMREARVEPAVDQTRTPTAAELEYAMKLDRAVAFMRNHGRTVRRAAEVYGVDRWDLLDRWNTVMGTNRQLVGEARPVTDGRRSTP